jgi:O-acetyl-ADP-ribose deacetylase (regulator of RNase III)
MKITIVEGDITCLNVDAIVNAANSYGYMGGGVAGAIKRKGGEEIEIEAVSQAPIPIGAAVITSGGSLGCKVIHAPTMEQPASFIDAGNVSEATRAALEAADEQGLKRIAIPGMGTGVGGVPRGKAAIAMIEVIINFNEKSLEEIILVDRNKEMVEEWKRVYGKI